MKNQMKINEELNSLRNEIAGLRSDLERLVEILDKQNSLNGPVRLAAESSEKKELMDSRIFNLLISYQVPVHLKGFTYLKEAIKMYIDDQVPNAMTKVIYPAISKKFNDTPSRVERAIRHAIERSFEKSHTFNPIYSYSQEKPTNSEFIALVAGKLLMEKQQESA